MQEQRIFYLSTSVLALCTALMLGCQFVRPIARTINDVAGTLCEITAAEQEAEALDGMSAAEWCAIHENVAPFLDLVLVAQEQGAQRAGFARDGAPPDEPQE